MGVLYARVAGAWTPIGTQGTQGPQGAQGIQGIQGPAGTPGSAQPKVEHIAANLTGGGNITNGEVRTLGGFAIPPVAYARRVFFTATYGIAGQSGNGSIIPIMQIGGVEHNRAPQQSYATAIPNQQAMFTNSIDIAASANPSISFVIYNGGTNINVACRVDAVIMPT